MSSYLLPLSAMQRGEAGQVADVIGDDRLVATLAERGLRAGGMVQMLTPGCPCVVVADGCRLSLRTDHQLEVLVEIHGAV